MNFDLTDDQRDIRRTARDFLAARYTPEKIRAIALDGQPDPYWDDIVELGWLGRRRARDRRARRAGRGARLRARALAAGRAVGGAAAAPGPRGPRDGRDVGRRRRRRPGDADAVGRRRGARRA